MIDQGERMKKHKNEKLSLHFLFEALNKCGAFAIKLLVSLVFFLL